MPLNVGLSREQAVSAYKLTGSYSKAAALLGVTRNTVKWHVLRDDQPEVELPVGPEKPLADLYASRYAEFDRLKQSVEQRRLIPVVFRTAAPIALVHMGDWHVDDPGSDLRTLRSHCELIQRTQGAFAGVLGDFTNNWVGRLIRLYAEQEMMATDSWRIVEDLITMVPWIYWNRGNHDRWSDGQALLDRFAARVRAPLDDGVRVGLRFPNGREVVVNTRHNYRGWSMWNAIHGHKRAASMNGEADHILACGHIHEHSGYGFHDQNADHIPGVDDRGRISHCFRLDTYKMLDHFGRQNYSTRPNRPRPCVTTIIDPWAEKEDNLVRYVWDIEEGVETLKWLRCRRAKLVA